MNTLMTPALVIDRGAMERNMAKMNGILENTSMKLYPHYKSHKCPAIALLQMKYGAAGITCAKLGEALDVAEAGISNIVIANQIVQKEKLPVLAALANRCRLTVCVDHAQNILDLEAAMAETGGKLHLLVEYDVGMGRCGVSTKEEVLALARLIGDQPHLDFEGIQAYAGHLSHEEDGEKRFADVQRIEADVAQTKAFCEEKGVAVREVCGGSTGFAHEKPKDTVYTQVQFGSYLFLDRSFQPLELAFEQALFVQTSVLSVKEDRVVVDCGVKTMTMDQYPPYFPAFPGAQLSFSEEHTTIPVRDHGLKPGDKLLYVPGHCCTTINTFDKVYVAEKGTVTDCWDITSRGKAQ
ncbi:MAG: alanine racemase [Clostridia bacterium]|nr:alanine racemase [Clostridia bacterium]